MAYDHPEAICTPGIRQRLMRAGGVDRAVVYAILGNIASLIFGPLTALVIAYRFSPELQGYYYTFGSLMSLQSFLDMGLGQAIIQFASHEWSNLELDSRGRIVGKAESFSRLISLGRVAFRWYGYATVVLILGIGPAGYLFFARGPASTIHWAFPWIALCFGVGASFYITPLFWLLQGCNQIAEYWYYRLVQKVVYAFAIIVTILMGAGLWAPSLASAAMLIWAVVFVAMYYRGFFRSILAVPHGPHILWRTEVWPVQWRVGISWLSANFTTSFFAPVLFHFSGPVLAGQMGMTVTLAVLLLAISSNWVVTKAPRFGVLVAQKKFQELEDIFWKSFILAIIAIVIGTIAVVLGIWFMHLYRHPLGARLLPPLPAGLLLLGSALSSISICLSAYLQAHKKEPLAVVYLLSGVLSLTLAFGLGSRWGSVGVTAGYLGSIALIQIPLTVVVFFRSRAAWRRERTDYYL